MTFDILNILYNIVSLPTNAYPRELSPSMILRHVYSNTTTVSALTSIYY